MVFARLVEWGVLRVDLSGGEPTLRKDFAEICKNAMECGLNVVVSTNGTVLPPDRLAQFPFVRWHVSLDSGFEQIHHESRLLRTLQPSNDTLRRTKEFIRAGLVLGLPIRVLTCVGRHNQDGLIELGEQLATLGVREWNISRILKAGRAQQDYAEQWTPDEEYLRSQVRIMRSLYPLIRIRYSNRVDQEGYFLLVLPDGSLATQFTDGRDKIRLGSVLELEPDDLRRSAHFSIEHHGLKWVSAFLANQPDEGFLFTPVLPQKDLHSLSCSGD